MKYAVLTKKIDELNVSDFDEEVLNQYKNLTMRKEGLSYTVDGQTVTITTDSLLQDMCKKQIELIFDDFAERVAKKTHEALERPQNCVKRKHYCETEDETGVHSQCRATCSNNAQVDKLRKAAEETEDNGVRKGILKAIEVLEEGRK